MVRSVYVKNINSFLSYKNRNWSTSAKRNNKYYFDSLLAFLGERPLDRDSTEAFFNYLKDQGKAESTRRQAETSIKAFVRWLHDEEIIPKNWALRIERTHVELKPRILPSQGEVIKLINQVTTPTKNDSVLSRFSKEEHKWCLLFIVTCSGTRNFETRSIKRNEVSISTNQILIKEGKTGERTISIPPIPWLRSELARRVEGRTAVEKRVIADRKHYKEDYSDRMFVVNAGRLEAIMRDVGKLWGRPMNVHDLRRICLRDLKSNGAGIDDIKNVAGHKNIETTLRYVAYDTDGQQKTLKNYSTEARKYHTSEEKVKDCIDDVTKYGGLVSQDFDGKFLTMKLRII